MFKIEIYQQIYTQEIIQRVIDRFVVNIPSPFLIHDLLPGLQLD
jgi:hypothetical protein